MNRAKGKHSNSKRGCKPAKAIKWTQIKENLKKHIMRILQMAVKIWKKCSGGTKIRDWPWKIINYKK